MKRKSLGGSREGSNRTASEAIRVVVRCRPLIKRQIHGREKSVIQCVDHWTVALPGPNHKRFTFDRVFGEASEQEEVYQNTALTLVEAALDGYNGTVFAYGQTGSGKTYTMDGHTDKQGIMRRAFEDIFGGIDRVHESGAHSTFLVRVNFVQIYKEEVYDLISNQEGVAGAPGQALELREDPRHGFFIQGVTAKVVRNASQCTAALERGIQKRVTGETAMNVNSSRSHTVFSITVEREDIVDSSNAEVTSVGVLNFVDLAGSEKLTRTKSEGVRKDEARYINSSLSALNNVIRALVANARSSKSNHVPYRDSTLTKILRESLGGTARCVMVANISPSEKDVEETASTLWHAHSAKEIRNKPTRHYGAGVSSIQGYKLEIARLKQQLEDQTFSNEQKISELTEALMVPTFVSSLAERWRTSAEAHRESNVNDRTKELTLEIQSMAAEVQRLKEELEVTKVRDKSEYTKMDRDLKDAKQEILHLRKLNDEQSLTLARMESAQIGFAAERQELLVRACQSQSEGGATENMAESDADTEHLAATKRQLQQALERLGDKSKSQAQVEQQYQHALDKANSEVHLREKLEQQLDQVLEIAQQCEQTEQELASEVKKRENTEKELNHTKNTLGEERRQRERVEEQLAKALESLKGQSSQNSGQSNEMHSAMQRLDSTIRDKEEREKQLLETIGDFRHKNEHLESSIQQLERNMEKVRGDALKRHKTEQAHLQQAVVRLQNASHKQDETEQRLLHAMNQVESETKHCEQTEQQLQQAMCKLEGEVQEREETEQQLQQAMCKLEGEVQERERTEQQLQQAMCKLEGEVQEREETEQQLQQAMCKLEGEVQEREETEQQLIRALERLEGEVQEREQTEQQLLKALERLAVEVHKREETENLLRKAGSSYIASA